MKWSLINLTLFLTFVCYTLSKTQSENAEITEIVENNSKAENKTDNLEKTSLSQQVENVTVTDKTEDVDDTQKSVASQDSFLLEIQYLNEQIKLANQKIDLIEQLRTYYLENNHTIPSISLEALNDLSIESLHSPVIPLYRTSQPRYYEPMISDRNTQEQAKERQEYFMTRIIKKFSIDFNHTIKEMLYLPTKQTQRASDEAATSSLIVFLTDKNEIFIYNLNGHFLHSFRPQHLVKRFTVNTFQDDYFIATLGTDNTVRVYNITVTRNKIEPPPPVDKPSRKMYGSKFVMEYDSILNITYDLETNTLLTTDEDFQQLVGRRERDYGSISFILGKNVKFFAVGDDSGGLQLFERNGKPKGEFKFPDAKFLSLQKHFPNPIFATDKAVGFFNPNMMEITNPYCDPPGEKILKVELDQFSTSNFYVLLESGDVLFYEIKQSGCKVVAKRSLHPSPTDHPSGFDIYSAKSFLFMISNKEGANIVAHNITDAQFAEFQDIEYHNVSLAQAKSDHQDIVRSEYITQRSSFTSSSIGTYFQYQNGTSVFVQYEISIPPKPSNDWLSNFRLPIVFIAVLLAIGYQFWNRKKKKDDDEVMETLNKFKLQEAMGGMGGMGGKKGGMGAKDFDSLKNTIESLSKQTNKMQDDLGNMSTKAFSQMTKKGGRGFDEDEIQEISTKKYI